VWVASNFCFEVYLSRSLIRQPGASAHHPLFVCALTWKILFVITFYGLTRQQHLDKKTLRVLQFSFNERIIKEMAARQWEKGVGQRQG